MTNQLVAQIRTQITKLNRWPLEWDKAALERVLRDPRCIRILQDFHDYHSDGHNLNEFLDVIISIRDTWEQAPKLTALETAEIADLLQQGIWIAGKKLHRLLPTLNEHYVFLHPDGSFKPIDEQALVEFPDAVSKGQLRSSYDPQLPARPNHPNAFRTFLTRKLILEFENRWVIVDYGAVAHLVNVITGNPDLEMTSGHVKTLHEQLDLSRN